MNQKVKLIFEIRMVTYRRGARRDAEQILCTHRKKFSYQLPMVHRRNAKWTSASDDYQTINNLVFENMLK